jgi:hypothetical protein
MFFFGPSRAYWFALVGLADAQIAIKRDAQDNIIAAVEFMKDGPSASLAK